MKIILHMGAPKTGTTALQYGLAENSAALARHQVHYPVSQRDNKDHHHLLTALYHEESKLRLPYRRKYKSLSAAREAADRFVLDAKKQAEKNGCHTVVFSSELLFKTNAGPLEDLRDGLTKIASDIEPVIYIREPAGQYKSRMQQASKSCKLHLPHVAGHRKWIEHIERVFQHRVTVRPYDRNQLVGGDIVKDFCAGVLKLPDLVPHISVSDKNTSMGAEAVYALMAYGELIRSSGITAVGQFAKTDRKVRLVRKLVRRFAAETDGLSKLELKDDLVDAIRRSATDFVWLRDEYGLEFPELDYDNISAENASLLGAYKSKDDLIKSVNPEIVGQMLMSVLDGLYAEALGLRH